MAHGFFNTDGWEELRCAAGFDFFLGEQNGKLWRAPMDYRRLKGGGMLPELRLRWSHPD
jgi:hypothetical protein